MRENYTLTQIMDMAIAIDRPIMVMYPTRGRVEIYNPVIDVEDGIYEVDKSIISFVENGILYVIPYFKAVINTLLISGFVNRYIYVPFSNGDYPVDFKEQWDNLLEVAKKHRMADFMEHCKTISDAIGLKPIPDELLQNCFEMPESGVHVTHFNSNEMSVYYPEIRVEVLNAETVAKLGKYTVKNGVCVFVYRNGNTYVTKNWSVVDFLCQNGYTEGDISVPFSNGETITDPAYAQKWAEITK